MSFKKLMERFQKKAENSLNREQAFADAWKEGKGRGRIGPNFPGEQDWLVEETFQKAAKLAAGHPQEKNINRLSDFYKKKMQAYTRLMEKEYDKHLQINPTLEQKDAFDEKWKDTAGWALKHYVGNSGNINEKISMFDKEVEMEIERD